jgi:hypothetical protein
MQWQLASMVLVIAQKEKKGIWTLVFYLSWFGLSHELFIGEHELFIGRL